MRIVHLSTSDDGSGAFVAARRLAAAQRAAGLDATLLVGRKLSADPHVVPLHAGRWGELLHLGRKAWQAGSLALSVKGGRKQLFAFAPASVGADVAAHPLVKQAELIHLHWTQHGFVSFDTLRALAALGTPVVWTQHDLWALTGGCLYPGACERWRQHCGHCPLLRAPAADDLSARGWRAKAELYPTLRPHLVAVSQWLAGALRAAPLTSGLPLSVIPNPIDTRLFIPRERAALRDELGIEADAPVVLFVARALSDPRKGFDELAAAMRGLPSRPLLVAVGEGPVPTSAEGLATHAVGPVSDPAALARLYAAADLFAIPSLEDNLPTTVIEALACGTPVVGYATGGIPEMVGGEVGALVPTGDRAALGRAIDQLLSDPQRRQAMGRAARAFAETNYGERAVAERHRELYLSLRKG